MVGRTLASLALDRRDEPSRLAFVDPSPPRVPPEPFHWIGGEAIRAGIIAQGGGRAAPGRPQPPDPLIGSTRLLARGPAS